MKFTTTAAVLLAATTSANAALISSAGDAALTGATVYDLNAQATGNFTTDTVGEMTFTGISGDLRWAPFNEGGDFGGDGQNLSTRDLGGSFRIDFAAPISAFASIWGAANTAWTVEVFNASDLLIDTQIFPSGPPYNEFYGIAAADISYAVFSGGGGDWVLLDDFRVVSDAAPVPLPAGGALLLAGLGAFGFMRNRKS